MPRASGREAFLPHQRSALRTALLPAIDSTKVPGVIGLLGATTGLILAALAATRLAEHAPFDHAHRLVPLADSPSRVV